ncbi:MAG: hypothetical protein DRK00_10960, partial [Thermoprotei archaeon]
VVLATNVNALVGYRDRVSSLATIFTYVFSGWEYIVMTTIILGILTIINTFINSVQQRKREIFVYASLGLSPLGAMLMFITESVTYALLGSVIGYILGFWLNNLFIYYGMLPPQFTFNFTSSFIVFSILVVILACLGGAIYPSLLASRVIVPSLERRWKIPTKPRGDVWEVPIPVRLPLEICQLFRSLLLFLNEHYRELGFERPGFRVYEPPQVDLKSMTINMRVALTPVEMGVVQDVEIRAALDKEESSYTVIALIKRLSGDKRVWQARNYEFLDDLRKQVLIWVSLPLEEKRKYLSS